MGHFRYAPPFLQQRPRPFQYFSLQHRRGTSARLVLIESFGPVVSKHFHVSLHRDARHAKSFHDFFRLHGSIDDHLAGEHTETPNVLFIVMEHWQVPVNVDHLARFFLNRDAVVDLGHPGGKYRQLSLRHPWFLARPQAFCNRFSAHSVFIKPPDLPGEIRRSEVLCFKLCLTALARYS